LAISKRLTAWPPSHAPDALQLGHASARDCDSVARMLELRPNCECCNKDLPPEAADAMICTYECTFCRDCVETRLKGVCPNCGGNLVPRPIRPAGKLLKDPPSTKRVFKPDCAKDNAA
jgi:hypothetical protein